MPYSKREVFFFDVKEVSARDVYALGEFLRLNMITAINRCEVFHGARGDEQTGASFSGGFTRGDSVRVEEWLREHAIMRDVSGG